MGAECDDDAIAQVYVGSCCRRVVLVSDALACLISYQLSAREPSVFPADITYPIFTLDRLASEHDSRPCRWARERWFSDLGAHHAIDLAQPRRELAHPGRPAQILTSGAEGAGGSDACLGARGEAPFHQLYDVCVLS